MHEVGEQYQSRFDRLAAGGVDVHGEARLARSLQPTRVLDAGCGTGRVAIELARHGIDTVGVDVDPAMLEVARSLAPELDWRQGDLATAELPAESFDLVVLAGNVMIFLEPDTEASVLARLSSTLVVGGRLLAGFQLGRRGWDLADYDRWAASSGLELVERWATWDRAPYAEGGDYSVSLHRRR